MKKFYEIKKAIKLLFGNDIELLPSITEMVEQQI